MCKFSRAACSSFQQSSSRNSILRLRKVQKSFGRLHVLKDISFEIGEGETFALLGPNGSGKTTTIRTILQTLHPDHGEISIHGKSIVSSRRELLGRVGFMLEHSCMIPELTLRQNLQIAGSLYHLSDVGCSIERTIRRLDMQTWRCSPLSQYSRGMLQKASLARALLHDPYLLILDEPFSGLDPMHQDAFRRILRDLRRRKKAILFCSHDLSEVERISTHLGIISNGRLVANGSVRSVLRECKWKKYMTEWANAELAELALDTLVTPVIAREERSSPCVATILVPSDCSIENVMSILSRHQLRPNAVMQQELTLADVFHCAVSRQNTLDMGGK